MMNIQGFAILNNAYGKYLIWEGKNTNLKTETEVS
jgi:hypothetical protein